MSLLRVGIYFIPDLFGREALTGIIKGNTAIKPDMWDTTTEAPVVKATYSKGADNYGYVITAGGFTIAPTEILSVNFYDSYDFITDNSLKYSSQAGYDAQYTNAKGLPTGSMTAIVDENGVVTKTYSAVYYDYRGRVIQSHATNHLGGTESEYLSLNFVGQALKRKLTHTNPKAGTTNTEIYTHTYDHAGRLLDTYHQLNSGSNVLIASNTYDELGRLKTDKKGNQANLTTDYTYDIRSRTKSMNSYHLKFGLQYTYGSNIAKQTWVQSGVSRNYAFTYDGLSRLKSATFSGGVTGEKFSTSYSYDKHGNILTMMREGKKGTSYALVDDLTFSYNGNQLSNIKDAIVETAKPEGETDFYSQAGDNGLITYNANGSMSSDTHKGISSMTYNVLNLPASITVDGHALTSGNVKYLYSASGAKVQTIHTENTNLRSMALMGTATYATGNESVTTTDYIGNKVYENNKLKRILIPGGYIEDNTYFYYLTDHLGNNRAVATATAGIVQRTQYYPFGLPFGDAQGRDLQPYTYNGKENDSRLQLNLMDYMARQNNNTYGRFTSMDPLAEISYEWSPYAYVENNPLRWIDPTGMKKGDPDEPIELDEVVVTPSSTNNGNDNLYHQTFISFLNDLGLVMTAYAGVNYTSESYFRKGYFRTSSGKTYSNQLLKPLENGKYIHGITGYKFGQKYAIKRAKIPGLIGSGIGYVTTVYSGYRFFIDPNIKDGFDTTAGLMSILYWEFGVAYAVGSAHIDCAKNEIEIIQNNVHTGQTSLKHIYNPTLGQYNEQGPGGLTW